MGTLDNPTGSTTKTVSKVVDLDNKTMPQVKIALDEWLEKGWAFRTIYVESGVPRAIFTKAVE
jgi:hypothetical protein